jgi:hypothetical protein
MPTPSPRDLVEYRAHTFRTDPERRVRSLDEAVEFVEVSGLIFFWPIKGITMPSLWAAVAGDRQVANAHDDPGHITWGWKDRMLDQRRWYYGKLLRGKATLVSRAVIPNFYALSDRVAELDDYQLAYHDGHLTHEARRVADVLLNDGPLHTVELRRRAQLSGQASKSRFEKALVDLQRGLWILPIGVATAGAWRYAFIYELFDRWYPQIAAQAHPIRQAEARATLVSHYLRNVGAATSRDVKRVFGWSKDLIQRTLQQLERDGVILPFDEGQWVCAELLQSLE